MASWTYAGTAHSRGPEHAFSSAPARICPLGPCSPNLALGVRVACTPACCVALSAGKISAPDGTGARAQRTCAARRRPRRKHRNYRRKFAKYRIGLQLSRYAGRDGAWETIRASLITPWSQCVAAIGLLTPRACARRATRCRPNALATARCAHPSAQAVAILTLQPVGPAVRAAPHDRLTELKRGLGVLML